MSDGHGFWSTGEVRLRQAETSEGLVEYADVGQGRPVLYFHGTGAGNDAAIAMERGLLDDGFRLIVPHRPGYYGTPLSCGRSTDDCADRAAELLDELGIERVAVVGTSGGGLSAPCFAARHPARTVALVLQCAVTHPFASSRWMPRHLRRAALCFRYPRVFLPILRWGFQREMRKLRRDPGHVLKSMSGERYAEICDDEAARDLVPLLADAELRCARHPAGIENDWINMAGPPWLTPDSVHCPTLVLHDRADPLVPFEHAEWAMHCLPGAELCDLHAGGHLIWVGKDAGRMRRGRTAFIRRQFEGGEVL